MSTLNTANIFELDSNAPTQAIAGPFDSDVNVLVTTDGAGLVFIGFSDSITSDNGGGGFSLGTYLQFVLQSGQILYAFDPETLSNPAVVEVLTWPVSA